MLSRSFGRRRSIDLKAECPVLGPSRAGTGDVLYAVTMMSQEHADTERKSNLEMRSSWNLS